MDQSPSFELDTTQKIYKPPDETLGEKYKRVATLSKRYGKGKVQE